MQLDSGNPPPSLCQQTLAQTRTGISLQVATPAALERRSPAVKLLCFFLTVVKPLQRRVMQLAGYFCPTTEEVAGESQDPAPTKKNIPPSLSPMTSTETSGVKAVKGRMEAPNWALCVRALVPFFAKVF